MDDVALQHSKKRKRATVGAEEWTDAAIAIAGAAIPDTAVVDANAEETAYEDAIAPSIIMDTNTQLLQVRY